MTEGALHDFARCHAGFQGFFLEVMKSNFNYNPLKCILCGNQLRRVSTQFGLTLREKYNYYEELATSRFRDF
ncbi:hypothetical protein PsalMR5_04658 (plasmid) [Piscirickettsia salmonis]|uniref:hypothetical protein n=1 Tax=Piscirickettsia salmonis TaxID=1238 RepID=UPI0012BAA69E|nr:hypothetical protein [Piscirickettsia salmonis]QGP56005.1 hypothetical protein PsalSR1_03475 [Piscirickettsia salmonis]QGP57196.1 hypothetical protein PsalSR1_04685 [Piscirickettsia salmonis]QGP58126.1 hypothetical protein PsalBI1_00680 [Piscirickettsia salmonis]QGP62061.1 hypothetical protein PsalBI1_04703 [Piscirickettsia salmonis]QGP65576.1 hypothetical protein PsalMR5_03482 [Piscirickettsia salmonis]